VTTCHSPAPELAKALCLSVALSERGCAPKAEPKGNARDSIIRGTARDSSGHEVAQALSGRPKVLCSSALGSECFAKLRKVVH
jgi:hypothetical protein